jgi:quinol monooxygenase YgiN
VAPAAAGRQITKPATYDLIYIEVAPRDIAKAITFLRAEEVAGREGMGNLGFLMLQRYPDINQFLIVGLWTDHASLVAYQNSVSTKQFLAALRPMMIAPYDERPNIDFLTNSARDQATLTVAPKNTLFVLAHVDVDPEDKAAGVRAIQALFLESQNEPDNFAFDVLNQSSRTNHFTLFEAWQSQTTFTAYKEQKLVRSFRNALLPIMGSIYEERLYRPID